MINNKINNKNNKTNKNRNLSNSSNNNIINTNNKNNTNTNKNKDNEIIKCRYCGSTYCVKHGKTSTNKERYLCKSCNKNFSLNDNRIKHPIKHILLALILLNKNISKRNIQKTLQEVFKIKLSYSVLDRWFKTFEYLLDNNKDKERDKDKNKEDKKLNNNNNKNNTNKNIPKKIDILEMDELWSYYYDLKKNEEKESKYGLLLTETEIKLLHLK